MYYPDKFKLFGQIKKIKVHYMSIQFFERFNNFFENGRQLSINMSNALRRLSNFMGKFLIRHKL